MFDVSLCVDDDEYLVEKYPNSRVVRGWWSVNGRSSASDTVQQLNQKPNFYWRPQQSTQNVPTNQIRWTVALTCEWLFCLDFKNRFISMTSKWSAAYKYLVKSAGGLMRHIFDFLVVRQPKHFTRPPPLSHRSRGAECLSFPRKIQPNSWKISLQNKVLVTWPPGKVGEKKNGTTAEGHSSDTHHAGDSQRERAASCVIWSITSRDLALAFPFSFEFFFSEIQRPTIGGTDPHVTISCVRFNWN